MSIAETEGKVGRWKDDRSYQSINCLFTEMERKLLWPISNSYRNFHLCLTLKISEHSHLSRVMTTFFWLLLFCCFKKWMDSRSNLFILKNVKTTQLNLVSMHHFPHSDNIHNYSASYDETLLLYLTENWLLTILERICQETKMRMLEIFNNVVVKPAGIMFLMKWNNNVEHYNIASTVM